MKRETVMALLLALASGVLGYLIGRWHADQQFAEALQPIVGVGQFFQALSGR